MPRLTHFSTPANIDDFTDFPAQREQMKAAWSANVNRWCNSALVGNVWDLVNYGPRPAFYNPMATDTPDDAANISITWNAFPGRLSALLPDNGDDWRRWADQGVPGSVLVRTDLCSQQALTPPQRYGPGGPRGWQDEYCEWSVERNDRGQITRVSFTCENPEYWFTLWQVSPLRVVDLYQALLGRDVQQSDLTLKDADGNELIDPTTGRVAYNPLNKWNRGTRALGDSGGAVHLTSSPNTLGAEFDLAAAATMPRVHDGQPVTSASGLMCLGGFGAIGRHSDPTIGQNVNATVRRLTQARATLTDPVGLYIQTPDFSGYVAPDGTDASTFWTVVRGSVKDPTDPDDIDRILRATFSVPESKGYTVSEIEINGDAIEYGSQISQTFDMALMATAFANSGVTQPSVGPTRLVASAPPAVAFIQDWTLFQAYCQTARNANQGLFSIPRPAFAIQAGQSIANVAVMLQSGLTPLNATTLTVPQGGVTIVINDQAQLLDTDVWVYLVTITADGTAMPGDRDVAASVLGSPVSPQGAIGLLTVTPATTQHVSLRTDSGRGRF